MNTTEGEFLFAGPFLSDYLRHRSANVRQAVEAIPRAEFDATDDETLISSVLADIRVEPLVLDRDNAELETDDEILDARDDPNRAAFRFRDRFVPLPATRFTFSIPFAGNSDLWELMPSTFGLTHARGVVRRGVLDLVFVQAKDSKEDLTKKLDEELALIAQNRERQLPEIEAFNVALRDAIRQAVENRRREFAGHDDLAARMGVRLKTRAPATPVSMQRSRGKRLPAAPTGAKKWDVFVSYAGEDRETIARPLAEALRARDLKVWFDKFELSLGDRLRRKIDEGLANSRFGVVVLSEAFFQKHWPQQELDGLAQREVEGTKVILPVWHGIDQAGVATHSPTLADRVAVSTAEGIDNVVAAIADVVQPT